MDIMKFEGNAAAHSYLLNWFGLEVDATQEVGRGLLLTGVPEQAELVHICCTGAPDAHDIMDD